MHERNHLLEELYKHANAVTETSELLADMLWNDETIEKQFVYAGLAQSILLAGNRLEDLLDDANKYIAAKDESD